MTVALTARDRALIRAAWSLGAATHSTLRALVSPATQADTLRRRLRQLHRAGYLTQSRHIGAAGCLWLYGAGRNALVRNEPRPWRPGLAQIEHTLAVGEVIVALTRHGFASPLVVTGWQGEAELRAWAAPGAPFPDARVAWRVGDRAGAWLVEVDRATESSAAWRRKLVRYLTTDVREPVFAVTTSARRAAMLATVARDLGVPLHATTATAVRDDNDPSVYDAVSGCRLALSETCRRVDDSTRSVAPM